jgi:hypothetical protein
VVVEVEPGAVAGLLRGQQRVVPARDIVGGAPSKREREVDLVGVAGGDVRLDRLGARDEGGPFELGRERCGSSGRGDVDARCRPRGPSRRVVGRVEDDGPGKRAGRGATKAVCRLEGRSRLVGEGQGGPRSAGGCAFDGAQDADDLVGGTSDVHGARAAELQVPAGQCRGGGIEARDRHGER